METRSFRALSSDIELIGCGRAATRRLDQAAWWLRGFEARFSRFDPASELSRLNAAAGRHVRVSPGLLQLVQLSLRLAARSAGVFDPTVLRILEASGYDRSFAELRSEGPKLGSEPAVGSDAKSSTWRAVEVDPQTRTVMLPAGSGLDLGGIGKGWAVDRMAAILRAPCLVNAGGDVFVTGKPEDGDRWLVGVEDPFEPDRDLCVLSLSNQGVATSSTLRRRWFDGQRWSHHLIDPGTGGPSAGNAVQVSVIAPSATLADFHAKVALLVGVEAGLRYLNQETDAEGLIVAADRSVWLSAAFESYVVQSPLAATVA